MQTSTKWISEHHKEINKYPGKWLAITSIGIVATANTFDDIFYQIELQKIADPVVFKVSSLDKKRYSALFGWIRKI